MGNRRQVDCGRNGQWDGDGWMGQMEPLGEGLSPGGDCVSLFGSVVYPVWPLHALSA